MPLNDEMMGATKSLRTTISEIERYLNSEDPAASDGINRRELNEKLADLAEWWFREGFAVAHRICTDRLLSGQSIGAITLREDEAWLGPDVFRKVELVAPSGDHPDDAWFA